MKRIRIAYFGTPYFSALFLEKLLTDTSMNRYVEVKLVVTQPDAHIGRKHILTASPVKVVAKKYGIPVFDQDIRNSKLEIRNFQMAFLFAYGNLIPNDLLQLPKYGFWNTHPSLLPLYRGPSPIVYPLILGEKKTGVTLIKLDKEIDHGPIIAQEETKIFSHERRPDLETRLTNIAYNLFKRQVSQLTGSRVNELKTIPQNHLLATFTNRLEKNDGFIPFSTLQKALLGQPLTESEVPQIIKDYLNKDPSSIGNWLRPEVQPEGKLEIGNSSKIIFNYFRGLYPWPGIWTTIEVKNQKKRLKLTDLTMSTKGRSSSGRNYEHLIINHVQLEGKKEVDFKTFQSSYKVF